MGRGGTDELSPFGWRYSSLVRALPLQGKGFAGTLIELVKLSLLGLAIKVAPQVTTCP